MNARIRLPKDELDLLYIRAYHYLEGYKLNETNLEQIIISFKLNEYEIIRLTKKIKKLKQKYKMSTQNLARAIIRTRYIAIKENAQIPFDEDSPLALL